MERKWWTDPDFMVPATLFGCVAVIAFAVVAVAVVRQLYPNGVSS